MSFSEDLLYIPNFNPPPCLSEHCRDVFPEFVAFVIIPAAVLLLVVLFLSCLMCCGRVGTEKRICQTSESELIQYSSIRQASLSLRQLSDNRDTPINIRSGSMSLANQKRRQRHGRVRGNAPHSAPGTLQRHQKTERDPSPPPPYNYSVRDSTWSEVPLELELAENGAIGISDHEASSIGNYQEHWQTRKKKHAAGRSVKSEVL